jgi:hypothetical protein
MIFPVSFAGSRPEKNALEWKRTTSKRIVTNSQIGSKFQFALNITGGRTACTAYQDAAFTYATAWTTFR